jgi:Protein of unknown function (DUF2800)
MLDTTGLNMLDAHSRFGGSVAPRILRCPASVRLLEKVPAHLRKSSAYAHRGTALHAAMALLIENECSLDDLIGKAINNYTLTDGDIENALRPAYAYVDKLLDQPGAHYFLEQRVAFPTIADAFGTADLIIRIGDTIHLVDFKFGSGVRVLALYPVGEDDVLNAQLMFYAAAARHTFPQFFAGVHNIILTILQPVSIDIDAEMVSSAQVTNGELDEFVTIFRAACAEAFSSTPRLQRGDHCRFCQARPICPEHTKPILDLSQFELPRPTADNYYQVLAAILDLADAVKDITKGAHDQAKQALHTGAVVPGYALSAGRAERHWQDESAAVETLIGLGLARDDVITETMRSPKRVELRAKARGLKVPQELIVSSRSGTSLVREENVRVSVRGRDEIAQSFSAALQAFHERREANGHAQT